MFGPKRKVSEQSAGLNFHDANTNNHST